MNRLLYDVSEEALARGKRAREHLASLGIHRRCDTNIVQQNGDCGVCGAINGENCRSPRKRGKVRMSALLKLAASVEAATGPDRELDGAICDALDTGRRVTADGRWLGPDPFTASIDAAMRLAPEGAIWDVTSTGTAWVVPVGDSPQTYGKAATPALALIAACLRARDSDSDPEGENGKAG